ncbi:MAG: carbamoyltransferase HypF, partial [Eggerthellaceae bacterium]|nr:carbamoyltransferase HypF [Eggerthellaceae bacterium]
TDAAAEPFTPGLADGLAELGVMLPYTPVQHLLMHDFAEAGGRMLVMTSGNVHDEPIQIDDGQAQVALAGIADALLGNNRAIRARYDDSVVRVIDAAGSPAIQVIRRARGYSPAPIKLPKSPDEGDNLQDSGSPCVFAAGPEQKNTFCLARGGEAFVGQHIGDLENAETFDAWLEAKARFATLFRAEPAVLACDRHPEYLSTKWVREEAAKTGLPVIEVQHHHAHIVSAMAEHGLEGPVCGVAFDGTGYGMDGAIWGGEVLLSNLTDFERFANFAYVPMPGGAAAVKNPLRMAYGVLYAYDLLEHPAAKEALAELGSGAELLSRMIEQGINTPYTSSVGRLFDATSALLGICTRPTYEGEPAILLEAAMGASGEDPALTGDFAPDPHYAVALTKNTAGTSSTAHDTSVVLLDARDTFLALLDDLAAGVPRALIARRFHDAIAEAIITVAGLVRALYGITQVVLSGGVFMNRYLTETVLEQLAREGFAPAINRDLPPNDGCVSFGQAVVAARLARRDN